MRERALVELIAVFAQRKGVGKIDEDAVLVRGGSVELAMDVGEFDTDALLLFLE